MHHTIKNTLIFSDVHLHAPALNTSAYSDFLAFLGSIQPEETERVICLGDLFDFWFEYRHAIFSQHFPVLRRFAELHEAGIELHLICGNHDFWAGAFLRDQVGFQVHHAPLRMRFDEREALLLHGDGLNPRDHGYRMFKRVARHPVSVALFRLVPPDLAMAIAGLLSRSSRHWATASPKESSEAQVLRAYARTVLESGEAALVLSGHSHAPIIERVETAHGAGYYLNPGDWPRHRSYIEYRGGEFTMQFFC